MAEREGTLIVDDQGTVVITWSGLRNGDTGDWVRAGHFADKTVQVIVTAAGSGDKVAMQGSPDNGVTEGDLHDAQGGLISAVLTSTTISDPEVISETPLWIRPEVTAGDGTTDLTVVVTGPSRGR